MIITLITDIRHLMNAKYFLIKVHLKEICYFLLNVLFFHVCLNQRFPESDSAE